MQDILFTLKKHGKDILIVILIIIALVLAYFKFIKEEDSKTSNDIALVEEKPQEETPPEVTEEPKINVDLKGAVKNPGVYEVDADAIVNDVIGLAGGFNNNAYQDGINLSKKVKDEMVIYIYTKNEVTKNQNNSSTNSNSSSNNVLNVVNNEDTCKTPSYTITECLLNGSSIIEVGESNITNSTTDNNTTESEINKIVNINTASINELVSLSGIGTSKAEAIIAYRREHGNFTSIEDLLNVKGIGQAVFDKIKSFITV